MQESKSPGPASAYRGAKTALRAVFRAREIPARRERRGSKATRGLVGRKGEGARADMESVPTV